MAQPPTPVSETPERRPLRVAVLVCVAWAVFGAFVFRGGVPPIHWLVTWLLPADPGGLAHAWATLAWVPLVALRPAWGLLPAAGLAVWGLAVPSTQHATLFGAVLALVVTVERPRWGWPVAALALGTALAAQDALPSGIMVAAAIVGVVIRSEARSWAAGRRRLAEVASRQGSVRREVRRQVARDLHDVVGHQLSVILMRILGHQECDDRVDLRAMLGHVERAARSGLDELRVLLDGLRSGDAAEDPVGHLDAHVSLQASLAALVGTLRGHGFVVPDPDPSGQVDLDQPVATTCRRVLTEAVTNIVRYAPAGSRVGLALETGPDGVRIEVTNPLPRVEPAATGLSGGVGLQGLSERVRLVGGRVDAGPVGDRWRVLAHLPLRATPAGTRPAGRRERVRAALVRSPGRVVATATMPLTAWGVWEYGPVATLATSVALPVVALMIWRPRLGTAVATVVFLVLSAVPGAGPGAAALLVYGAFVAGAWLPIPLTLAVAAAIAADTFRLTMADQDMVGFLSSMLSLVLLLVAGLVGRYVGHLVRLRRRELERADARLGAVRAEEEDALARELHDLVTRQLTLVSLQGMSYSHSDDPDELHAALVRVESATREALTELRRLVGVLLSDAAEVALVA